MQMPTITAFRSGANKGMFLHAFGPQHFKNIKILRAEVSVYLHLFRMKNEEFGLYFLTATNSKISNAYTSNFVHSTGID